MDRLFFAGNRRRLRQLALWADDHILVMFSGLPKRRSADEDYEFYGNRNFAYMTGLTNADLVYLAWQQKGDWKEILFLPDTDPIYERWMGRMLHADQVEPVSGINETRSRTEFEGFFHRLVGGMCCPTVWLDFDPPSAGQAREPAQQFADTLRHRYPYCRLANCHGLLQQMRTIKQPEEIDCLRRSIDVTKEGIEAMLHACRPGLYEYQLRSVFEKVLADQGFREPAFETIVGAGRNSLVMHYPEQDSVIRDGDMILIDLGAQCGFCGADISRVFPANGHFTPRQRQLHEASISTISYLCDRIRPGMSMRDIDLIGDENLARKLEEMGLLEGGRTVEDYRWHTISHHLGFDTHDDNDYGMPIAPGMVFTMEVGVYVEDWGEGVRIEDIILVTEDGCENLSIHIPREIHEIEAVMAQAR